jgi:hypothetical protein
MGGNWPLRYVPFLFSKIAYMAYITYLEYFLIKIKQIYFFLSQFVNVNEPYDHYIGRF